MKRPCIMKDVPGEVCFGIVKKVKTETLMGFTMRLRFCEKHLDGYKRETPWLLNK